MQLGGGRVPFETHDPSPTSAVGRRREADPRAAERRAAIVESVDDAVIATTLDGTITDWNPAAERLLGYPAADVLGRPVWTLAPPDGAVEQRVQFDRVRNGERVARYRAVRVRADGTRIDVAVSLAPVRDDTGSMVGVVGVLRDITAQVQAEDALRESEQRFREFAERATDVVFRVRLEPVTRIEYISPSARAMSGYGADELYGSSELWRRAVDADDIAAIRPTFGPTGASVGPFVLRVTHRDGHRLWVEVHLSLVQRDGRLVAVDGIARDITARKDAEDALARTVAQLRAVDELKNAFLHTVSHDLRNPLTVIRGMARTLEQRGDRLPSDQRADLLRRIAANAERVTSLVNDLLDFERLERGSIEPARTSVDLGALVWRVVGGVDTEGHPVRVDAPRVVVEADRTEVERIVENLVANAVRHTPEGTPIWVRVSPADGGAVVQVDDAGPGVPDGLREAIFEPFRTGAGSGSGSGLGLSLVARFAAVHGGRAWVEDRPGGGAAFRVFLPAS